MYIVKAKLVKRKSDNGFFEVFENVPLGKIYLIDLDTISEREGFHIPTKTFWKCTIVDTDSGWFPIELLDYSKSLQ